MASYASQQSSPLRRPLSQRVRPGRPRSRRHVGTGAAFAGNSSTHTGLFNRSSKPSTTVPVEAPRAAARAPSGTTYGPTRSPLVGAAPEKDDRTAVFLA